VLSNRIERVRTVIFINNKMRRYYGKKYYRQTATSSRGRAQAGQPFSKGGANQERTSQGTVRVIQSTEAKIEDIKL